MHPLKLATLMNGPDSKKARQMSGFMPVSFGLNDKDGEWYGAQTQGQDA